MPNPSPQGQSGKIFISYRREDSQSITGRIYDWFSDHTPQEGIFIDFDDIDYGANFVQHIEEVITKCRAMLVVIGPHWLNEAGELSHNVRVEVEQALQHGLQIIPLLVEGASLPSAESVPDSVRTLIYLNAVTIRSGRDFRQDMQDIAQSLDLPVSLSAVPAKQTRGSARVSRRALLAAAGVVGVAALGLGVQRWAVSRTQVAPRVPPRVYPYASRSVLYVFEADSTDLLALNVSDGSIRWRFHTEAEFTSFDPLDVGTTVYMGTNDGTLYAFDGDKGGIRWQQSFPGAALDNAFAVGGTIYLNTGPHAGSTAVLPTLYALAADSGTLRWQVGNFVASQVQDAVYGFLTERGSTNGFTTDDVTGLAALNLEDGKARWSYSLQASNEFSAIDSQLVLGGQSLYIASEIADLDSSDTSTLYAFSTQSGKLMWQAPTTGKTAVPLPVGETVYVSAQLNSPAVIAVSALDGKPRWQFPITPGTPDELGEPSALSVAGDTLLFAADGVYELDMHTGNILSHYLDSLGIDAAQPLIVEDMLYVTSPGFDESSYAINTYATVYAVSRQTNDRPLIWKTKLPSGHVDNLMVVGDMLFFSSGADGLYAVNRRTGATLWRFRSGKSEFSALAVGS
jgi:outer membrane protein assembly factor BamB